MEQPRTRKPGDRFVRRARLRSVHVNIAQGSPIPARPLTPLILAYLFGALICLGTLLLLLPISSTGPGWTPFMDALFTATSAVTVTGLTVADSATAWTGFGKIVLLLLIQIGGLGIMTITTFLLLVAGRKLGLRERFTLSMESSGRSALGGAVHLAKVIALAVLVAELIGFVFFTIKFTAYYPIPTAMWHGLFHAVSSFNNAGFVILPQDGFAIYNFDLGMLFMTGLLIAAGCISYVVMLDWVRKRRWARLTLDTKLVLTINLALWFAAAIIIFASEYTNEATLGPMGVKNKIANSIFEAISGRTAGFESVAISSMRAFTWLPLMALMFIGGTTGSAAGGIKVNTLGVIITSMLASVRGRPKAEAFRKQIPDSTVMLAVTLVGLGIVMILVVSSALTLLQDAPPIELLFETVSALGTTGNSTGVTKELNIAAQALILITMFVGKIGPVTLMLRMTQQQHPTLYRHAEENVRVG